MRLQCPLSVRAASPTRVPIMKTNIQKAADLRHDFTELSRVRASGGAAREWSSYRPLATSVSMALNRGCGLRKIHPWPRHDGRDGHLWAADRREQSPNHLNSEGARLR